MKRLLITGAFITAALSATAGGFYDQLCAFNFNWKKYSMIAPKGEARAFKTDADYVQAHLSCVIPILKSNPTDALSADQLNTRMHLINLLDGYRAAKLFPLNHYRTERIPVFIDEHGTHCAVGYLMMKSGYEELAQRISRTDNYVWVKDIKDPQAIAWQNYSGFTMEELKLIQGAYDWYDPNAWYVENRYETPQMPTCTTAFFDNTITTIGTKKEDRVWCKGEGNGKILNGKWEQNYSPGIPWIKGFFSNGKRSGNWEEYYPGTNKLCRTESWRNNKLNGTRTRYDMAGTVIEEIVFAEGAAVCKINYDYSDSLTYIRVPLDSSTVMTKVYNSKSELIACGKEIIYNPSNLLWFQNIQLTALNSIQVSTRANQFATGNGDGALSQNGGYNTGAGNGGYSPFRFSNEPQLVQYHKTGTWMYYKNVHPYYASHPERKPQDWWYDFGKYGTELHGATYLFKDQMVNSHYDSIKADYDDNYLTHFYGYKKDMYYTNVSFSYHEKAESPNVISIYGYDVPQTRQMKSAGCYNAFGERIGEWKYYNNYGTLIKTENYLVPMKEEDVEGAEDKTASR